MAPPALHVGGTPPSQPVVRGEPGARDGGASHKGRVRRRDRKGSGWWEGKKSGWKDEEDGGEEEDGEVSGKEEGEVSGGKRRRVEVKWVWGGEGMISPGEGGGECPTSVDVVGSGVFPVT